MDGIGKCNYGRTGSTCRKAKRNNTSDKMPKQPQRGLGVAQLEKIRMQNEIMAGYNVTSSHQSPYSNGYEMGYVDASRSNTLYTGSHQRAVMSSTVHGEAASFSHNYIGQPNNVALPLFAQGLEDSNQWKNNYNYPSAASTCYHYYHQDDNQDVDLELRLAL